MSGKKNHRQAINYCTSLGNYTWKVPSLGFMTKEALLALTMTNYCNKSNNSRNIAKKFGRRTVVVFPVGHLFFFRPQELETHQLLCYKDNQNLLFIYYDEIMSFWANLPEAFHSIETHRGWKLLKKSHFTTLRTNETSSVYF